MPTVTTQGSRVTKQIDISSLSIKKCADIQGVIFIESTLDSRLINSINSSDSFSYCSVEKTNSSSVCADELFIASTRTITNNAPCYITIQYTKTTD